MPSANTNKAEPKKLHRRVHARAKHHYYRVMPDKKRHRILIWVAFLSYAAIVAGQMLYPLDRALPLATAGSSNVGWQAHSDLAKRFNDDLQVNKLTLVAGKKKLEYPLKSAGADFNSDEMIGRLTNYPFWQRFVPFSIAWQPVQQREASVYFSPGVLKKFSKDRAKELSFQPKSARVAIEKGKLIAENDVPGQQVTAAAVKQAITKARTSFGASTVQIPSSSVKPATTAADFSEVKAKAEAALARPVTIVIGGTEFTPKQSVVASWLLVGADKQKKPLLKFDEKSFAKYLDSLDKEVGKKPGMTNITLTNGIETARSKGKNGKAIDRSGLAPTVRSWLLSGEGTTPIQATLKNIAPAVIYNSKYTATEAGLRAYVKDKSRQMNVHIAIRQLSGQKWTASARADESIPSASTYKVFVAKWLFDQMDAGKITWNSPILGTTVSNCFDQMTIASTNECAHAWLAQYGRSNMNNYVYKLGFSGGTSFTNPIATHTTATDLMNFMTQLQKGSIIGGAHRDRLLHSLSVHPYRKGVPSGSSGQVWNKVGFLWDYTHDAAIVKHPRGTYVIVVMTKGYSYSTIATITREVERIMYP